MSKDWKEFFKIWDYISNGKSEYGPTTSLSIEELYQAFKARLMDELFVHINDSAFNGILRDRSDNAKKN